MFETLNNRRINRRPRVTRISADIRGDNWRQLRLSQMQTNDLVNEFCAWRGKGAYSSEKRVEIFLSMMASGGYYRQVGGHTFGLATSTGFAYTHEVADFISRIANEWIMLPTNEELQRLSSDLVLNNGEMKRAILYVDGTIVRIMRPDHALDSFYCGRPGKHCDSINVQIICDKFGYVRHVVTGFSGKTFCNMCELWLGLYTVSIVYLSI